MRVTGCVYLGGVGQFDEGKLSNSNYAESYLCRTATTSNGHYYTRLKIVIN